MRIEGSCHCGNIRFRAETHWPYPYQHCYCGICRKTAGGAGHTVNIMALAETLRVEGDAHLKTHRVRSDRTESGDDDGTGYSKGRRRFCTDCGAFLWIEHPDWPQWVHPFAGAIDTPLPEPPERVHMMLRYRAPWVRVPEGPEETRFETYPEESIEDWHAARGLTVD